MSTHKPYFARIAFYALLATVLCGTAMGANAQTFSDRTRAAYENLTPSQRREAIEQMSRDGVLSPGHKALTTTGQGAGNLVFMKGLNCTEWMLNEKIVRKSWLNQYFDTTQSKDAIPINSNDDSALNVVDDYCSKNGTAPIENAFAAAFRRSEAALLLNREESRKRAEDARKNAEEDKRKREAEARAKSVVAATEESRKENNPVVSPTAPEISCDAWRKKRINLRLTWLKQYLLEINVTDNEEFVKRQELRLQRFCYDHPDATTTAAHVMIVGSAGGSQVGKETALPTIAANGQPDARISWRSKLHSNGAKIMGVSINGKSYDDATSYVSIRPGFNTVDYTCVWANGKSRQGTLDFIAKGNGEYSMTTISHYEGAMPKIAKMDHYVPYRSDLTRPTENDCSAQLFECTGYLYISDKRLSQACLKEKAGFLSMFNNKDGYVALIDH